MKFTKPTASHIKAFEAATKDEASNSEKAKSAKLKAWAEVGHSLGLQVLEEPLKGAEQIVVKDESQIKVLNTAKEFWEPLYAGKEGGFAFWWSRCLNQAFGLRFKAWAARGAQTEPKGATVTTAPPGFKVVAEDAVTFVTVESGLEILAEALDVPLEADEARYLADHFAEWVTSLRATKKAPAKAKLARR